MPNEPFVTLLADLCRMVRIHESWLFVPNHSVGVTLGDCLAREGCDWANLRFVTPLDIAIRMAAPFLLERGIDPSEEQLGPALMMRLLLDLPEAEGYFRPMAAQTSMAEALWHTIRELRHAGVRAKDLAAKEFTASPAKREEIVGLLGAYERYLDANHIADMPIVLEEAARHQGWCPITAQDIVIELPDVLWSSLVRQFLDSLPGQRVAARTIALPDVTIPERAGAGADASRATPIVERVEIEATTDASRLKFLQSVSAGLKPCRTGKKDDGTLDIFHAGGRDAEVDEIFRRILAAGCPLDQVEIACASDAYPMLVWEKAARIGWPVTVSSGVPATATRPGRLLLRFCDWVESDFGAAELRALLQAGDCAPPDADLSPGQAARLLLKAQATWGRGTYRPALTRLAEKYERRAQDAEFSDDERAWNARKEGQTRTLLAWIEGVLATVPAQDRPGLKPGTYDRGEDVPAGRPGLKPGTYDREAHDADGDVELAALVQSAQSFLEANAGRASAIDAIAYVAVIDALNDLRALGDYRCDLPAALRFLRERAASLAVGRDRPRPGHLHVSSLADAGYDGRRLVFIVGLQEGGVFPTVVEDPVLLDDERKAIHPLLRTSTHRQDEAVFTALSRLAAIGAASERVCLSFSCRDTREFRETFPSWIVLQAFRLKMADATLTYDDLKKWLGEPASAVPRTAAQAVSDAGWWLAQVLVTPKLPGAAGSEGGKSRDAILRAHPSLVNGIRAEEQRASDAFTEFDGLVSVAGPVLDPSRADRPVSATTLESAAKCPLRFFLERGLGVRVIEEGRAEEDAWLDPLTRGSELHALFARVMRAARDEKRKPSLKTDQPRLRKWGQQRLEELREEMPPPSDEVFTRESRDFLDDLDAFIEAECEGRHGEDPVGFEVAFGFPLEDKEGKEPLASEEPVAVDLGDKRRIVLHGRIDRINRVAPGQYEVIDYKTGGYWPDDWQGEFAGGTRLQHALYGVAAASLLKRTDPKAGVVQGIYVFPAVKGYRHQKRIDAPSKAKLASLLRDLADVIGKGAFAPADGEGACRWCDFTAACHATDVTRAASKRDNPANAVLEPYRRLRDDHE